MLIVAELQEEIVLAELGIPPVLATTLYVDSLKDCKPGITIVPP